MTRVVVSPEAERDLRDLLDRIADAVGERTAESYVDRLVTVVERLARIPRASGRPVPQLGEGLRCHPFGNYNLYLRYEEPTDILFLVRVLHGRRNIVRTFFEP